MVISVSRFSLVITILIAKKFLRTLRKPVQNSTNWFAAKEIEAMSEDVTRLNKATKFMQGWTAKNGARNRTAEEENRSKSESQ